MSDLDKKMGELNTVLNGINTERFKFGDVESAKKSGELINQMGKIAESFTEADVAELLNRLK